jgi:ParB family chromosome partitioning protein
VALIVPNAKQPRKTFEPEAFAELVHSVREFGVLQPIVVRPLAKKSGKAQFELIMGERRFRATKEAGLTSIPAIIRDTANEHMLRDALLENLHRAELNPLEEASAYQQLLEDFGITQDELADRMGRSRPQITNTIRLLKLPTAIQLKVASGVLSAGHARAILGAAASRREYWADRVINEGLSVRTLEERLSLEKTLEEAGSAAAKAGVPAPRLEILDEMAAKLADRVSTRVKIKMTNKKGQILIEFANLNDLKRILNELDPA